MINNGTFPRCVSDSHEDNADINIPAADWAGHSSLFVVKPSGKGRFVLYVVEAGRGRGGADKTATPSLQVYLALYGLP